MHLDLLCGMAFAGKTTLARALGERIRENERTRERSAVTEPVLLDLARKFEAPAADENVLVFPADAAPEGWIAKRFSGSR